MNTQGYNILFRLIIIGFNTEFRKLVSSPRRIFGWFTSDALLTAGNF